MEIENYVYDHGKRMAVAKLEFSSQATEQELISFFEAISTLVERIIWFSDGPEDAAGLRKGPDGKWVRFIPRQNDQTSDI